MSPPIFRTSSSSFEPEPLNLHGFTFWPFDETIQLINSGEQYSSLYEYVGANNTAPMMVGVNEEGKLISRCGTGLGGGEAKAYGGGNDAVHNAISSDGDTVFFTALECGSSPKVNELYARIENGQPYAHTVAISEPSTADCATCETSEVVRQPAYFEAGSEDGSKAFFVTTQPLLEGAVGENIYEYDFDAPAGQRVIRVSAGDGTVSNPTAGVEGIVQVSQDGSQVYFVASGALTTDPNDQGQVAHTGANNLYVYERDAEYPTGRIVFIADLSSEDDIYGSLWSRPGGEGGHQSDVTPDGRFLVFRSSTPHLTADDTSTATQVFEYDSRTGSLARVSIGQNGFNDNGNTDTGDGVGIEYPTYYYSGISKPNEYWGHLTVSSDGSYVFFQSADGLTPQAFNFRTILGSAYVNNVYEYHGGNVYLISDGRDISGVGGHSTVALDGTDASGDDVFFYTEDQLAPQDIDSDTDIYDARIDGGFAAPPVTPECSGDNCQGPLSPTPTLLAPGSEFQAGGANVVAEPSAPATNPKGKTKGKVKRKKGKRKPRKRAKKPAVRSRKASRASALGAHGTTGRGVR